MGKDVLIVTSATPAADLGLLTPNQLCELLQVRKSWVYDQVEQGKLPCLRLGKQLRFRRGDIDRYLDGLAEHQFTADRHRDSATPLF
jgi:excisionase family DNA binding protein